MKFVFAVVMLALAVCVNSSLLAAHAPGVSYVTTAAHGAGPWGAPWGAPWGGPWGGAWAHAPAAIDLGAHGGWGVGLGAHGAYGGYPGIALSQGPSHAGLGLGHGLAHAGLAHGHGHAVYVAKTRGAIHTAPLAGHIASATSVNVAPAPGTH